MSALPFSLLILVIAVAIRPLRWSPLIAAIVTFAGLAALSVALAGNAFLENVWSNQIASIPDSPAAWISSITAQGSSIIRLEGLFILLALLGMFLFLRTGPGILGQSTWNNRERGLVTLWGIASVGSAAYVVKGGTVDYIFTLAEPAVALFAAHALVTSLCGNPFSCKGVETGGVSDPGEASTLPVGVLPSVCRIALLVGIITLLSWEPWQFNRSVRFQTGSGVDLPNQSDGRIVEFSDREVRTVEKIIEGYAQPGKPIWAPPFFAALSKRPLAMDLSETYLWFVRWASSIYERGSDEGVEEMIEGLTQMISNTEIPLFLLNSRSGQWGCLLIPDHSLGGTLTRQLDPRLDRLQKALEEHYHPLLEKPGSDDKLYLQGWNERLEVWVPKERERLLPPSLLKGFLPAS